MWSATRSLLSAFLFECGILFGSGLSAWPVGLLTLSEVPDPFALY